jgi:hypothetical protein
MKRRNNNMDARELLPIGSIIQVKEAEKEMMIIGILQQNGEDRYDYIGVLYPEGYMSQDEIYLFNHEDIEKVSFLGYVNIEHQTFRNNLNLLLEEMDQA